jgi:hypothetical protein
MLQLVPVRAQAIAFQDDFNRINSTSSMEEIASAQLFAVRRHNQDTNFTGRSRLTLSGI